MKFDSSIPQLAFAAAEIQSATQMYQGADFSVEMLVDPTKLQPQCYRIEQGAESGIRVIGGDANGAMYGGLDIAEAIRLGTLSDLSNVERKPYIEQRGMKFNIPLDVRTPSYSDTSDSAQQNIPEVWSFDFWREFLDEMARHRFNVLTLWNMHPFPSLVKVPDYPGIALDDVQRTRVNFDSASFSLEGNDIGGEVMLADVETIKKISIDEKIEFWREVMQYAHDRGIGVYLFTWNIFLFGTGGQYGLTTAQDNSTTIDYFRQSVRETLLTYPLLKGFGITAGENMQRSAENNNEEWLWETYGEGIADVKKLQPHRSIRLIHRFHFTNIEDITTQWQEFPDTMDFSYKYSVAHMYSSPTPPFAASTLKALPSGRKTWLTVRNDDIYSFRWCDPEYARAYILGMPDSEVLAGFYMGPDGYNWGREFISTEPESPRQLVIKKQWMSFSLWGRLSYDPTLPDALFETTLTKRFSEVPGAKLFEAYKAASQVIPQITRFFWGGGGNDFEWFPEACVRRPSGSEGFHCVLTFMKGHCMPGSGILDISAYTQKLLNLETMNAITPPQVAEALTDNASTTLRLLEEMPEVSDKELRLTLGDLQAMAHLGNYYAQKILGATQLALFDATGEVNYQSAAIKHLEEALDHWKCYAAVYSRQYQPQRLNRIGLVDIPGFVAYVERDIETARAFEAKPTT